MRWQMKGKKKIKKIYQAIGNKENWQNVFTINGKCAELHYIMMDLEKKGGGAYEPTTHASSASCFSHENLIQYHPQSTASDSTQDLGHSFFHLVGK